jgi:hypothetical protein
MDGAVSSAQLSDLAGSLERISQKKLKHDVVRHWFQGGEPYFDLFLNTLADRIVWFQFTFRGNSICWSQQDPVLRTGVTTDYAMNDVSFYSATKTVRLDEEINPEFLAFARGIFSARQAEPPFGEILKILSGYSAAPEI